MKRPLVSLVVTLAFATIAFSGCVSDAPTVATRAAPAWAPGFSWSWAVSTEHEYRGSDDAGPGEVSGRVSGTLTHTVVADAPAAGDTPVYWVRTSGADMDGPIIGRSIFQDDEGLTAVAQADLQPMAFVSSYDARSCGGATAFRLDDGERFRLLDFPLDEGRTWSGDNYGLGYEARVVGVESVGTPAGDFDAIKIDFTVTPREMMDDDEDGEVVTDFAATLTVWYAPSVRNIVRMVSDFSAHVEEPEEEFYMEMRTELALSGHSLVAGTPEDIPEITFYDPTDEIAVPEPAPAPIEHRIIADRGFPLNAAEDPTLVTFSLDPPLATADAQVDWYLLDMMGRRHESMTGERFTTSLGLGVYTVDAIVTSSGQIDRPLDCGRHAWPVPAWSFVMPLDVEVFWARSYEVTIAPGLAAETILDEVEIPGTIGDVYVTFSLAGAPGAMLDRPAVVVRGPGGQASAVESGGSVSLDPAWAGSLSISWDPQTTHYVPVTLGHTATIDIEMRFA